MDHHVLKEVLILLAATVVAVTLFRRLKLPSILAYLFVGMLVGPHALGWIPNTESTRFLAEFGVVFLMFTIGLEFSLPQLIAMKKMVFGLGAAQVILTAFVAGGIAWLLGMPIPAAVAIGGIIAMSSTAIVSKQLAEQMELRSRHGHKSIAILLFQDVAVIPFILMIPILAGGSDNGLLWSLTMVMAMGILVLVVLLAAGHWLLRPMFRLVAQARSEELFMLAVLMIVLGAAWITHEAGLSLALGAFLVGMMIGETEYRHQVEADIRPFRDVLLGLFFITVGMLLDISAFPEMWHWVLLLLISLVLIKLLIVMGLTMLLTKSEPGVALRTGLTLAHGGEFSFVLISLALASNLLGHTEGQVLIMTLVASMMLAPLMIRSSYNIAQKVFTTSYNEGFQRMEQETWQDAKDLKGHVIICGYGPFGQNVGYLLEQEGVEFVALDLDPLRVQEAREAGVRVHYGDAARKEMLVSAGLENARALVISYRNTPTALQILHAVREECPALPVLVRTQNPATQEVLKEHGATEVFPETVETSITLSGHLLMMLGTPAARFLKRVQELHNNHYRPLRGVFQGQDPLPLDPTEGSRERLHPVTLPEGAHAIGRTLEELRLEDIGVTVTAVRRGGIRGPQPDPDTLLQIDDVLVLYGTLEDMERAESLVLSGLN